MAKRTRRGDDAENGGAEQANGLERERLRKEVADLAALPAHELRQTIAEQKDASRRALVSLLDHLDQLPDAERLATLVSMGRELHRTIDQYWQYARAQFPGGLAKSPRAEAYAAGRAEHLFRESFLG